MFLHRQQRRQRGPRIIRASTKLSLNWLRLLHQTLAGFDPVSSDAGTGGLGWQENPEKMPTRLMKDGGWVRIGLQKEGSKQFFCCCCCCCWYETADCHDNFMITSLLTIHLGSLAQKIDENWSISSPLPHSTLKTLKYWIQWQRFQRLLHLMKYALHLHLPQCTPGPNKIVFPFATFWGGKYYTFWQPKQPFKCLDSPRNRVWCRKVEVV